MSALTSSAFGGSKAKPKAPPRRRAAAAAAPTTETPQTAKPSQEQNIAGSVQEIAITVAGAGDDAQPTLAPPSPPVVVERAVHVTRREVIEEPQTSVAPGDVSHDSSTSGRPQDRAPAIVDGLEHSHGNAVQPVHMQFLERNDTTDDSPRTTRKRVRGNPPETSPKSNKRSKQSSARSSDRVQNSVVQASSDTTSTAADVASDNAGPSTTENAQAGTDQDDANTVDALDATPRAIRTRRASRRKQDADNQNSQTVPRRARQKSMANEATQNQMTDETTEENNPATQTQRAKPVKARKRASKHKSAATVVEDDESPVAEVQDDLVDDAVRKSEEEDPEEHKIDPKTLSMFDLSYSSKYGKVSEREKKMAQIDWSAVKQKRIEEADAIARGDTVKAKDSTDVVQSTGNVEIQTHDSADEEQPQHITRASGGGVRFRLVNGTIVEDVDSLTIDRAARVVAAAQDASVPVEEENDLTRRLNRSTWVNARKRDETERVPMWKSRSGAWNEEETDRFYDALRMFGTDFFVISQLFEGRTRRMIKLKFVREERLEPDRINAALLGQRTSKIDLDQYAQAIGKGQDFFNKYDSLAHANEAIRESFKDKEEAMRAAMKEDEENNRQREHQRQQREKSRLAAEKKKAERARIKEARRRGDVWGAGTLAAADDGDDGVTGGD